MKKNILIIPFVLLLAAACNSQTLVQQENQLAQSQTAPTSTPQKQKNLPPEIFTEQVGPEYSINGNLYKLILEPNSNFNLPGMENKTIVWHGVLKSQDNGQTWIKFFSITDPSSAGTKIKYNPVGVFSENQKIYLDIANDRGAGSGEGQLVRFSTNNNGSTWERTGCYYFIPENYYMDYSNFKNGKANTDTINPNGLKQTKNCVY